MSEGSKGFSELDSCWFKELGVLHIIHLPWPGRCHTKLGVKRLWSWSTPCVHRLSAQLTFVGHLACVKSLMKSFSLTSIVLMKKQKFREAQQLVQGHRVCVCGQNLKSGLSNSRSHI